MPNCTGFGDYTESGQVIPVSYKGQKGSYIHSMYLDVLAPVAAGREIWGFPKKIGKPALDVYKNILSGTLDFGRVRIATGTMGFKYQTLDFDSCHKALTAPNFLLKIIPDVDGSPKICELVRCQLEVKIKGAWTGPCSLQLFSHALAPVSDLPIKKILSGSHILTDVVLPYGEVVYDYLKNRGKK
jgi:acetoacetate decarboxylase